MLANELVSPKIMIVDDSKTILFILNNLLREGGYQVMAFSRAEAALRKARQDPPELILMDINMPGMDGYEACGRLKADPILCDIPVIFISTLNEPMDKVRAFQTGAVDYVHKPFQEEEVLARVETHLKNHFMKKQLSIYNHRLEELVSEQVREIADSQLATIIALAKLAESRDDDTGQHLERVQALSKVIITRMQKIGLYASQLDSKNAHNICSACPLHDIGKVGIPDKVLLKQGRLTPEEFEIMKTHTIIGGSTLQAVYEKYPNNSFIKMGIAIARWHHERWDGMGYPDGLEKESIPLSARIMSVVDVYDALRCKRPYKESFSHQKALGIMVENSGKQFDPNIISAFLDGEKECARVYEETFSHCYCG